MPTNQAIISAARKIAPLYGIDQVYLFGSYARGEATEGSDVDIRIVGGNLPSLFEIGSLYEDFIEALGCTVDIILTKNMSDDFYSGIKNDEVLIYARQKKNSQHP